MSVYDLVDRRLVLKAVQVPPGFCFGIPTFFQRRVSPAFSLRDNVAQRCFVCLPSYITSPTVISILCKSANNVYTYAK